MKWVTGFMGVSVSDPFQMERMVEQYLGANKRSEAVKCLFDLIVEHAGKQDFPKAEALREKIFDIDPMALREIVESAEIINEAKSRAIGEVRRRTWSGLLETLTVEESCTLCFALEDKVYGADQAVFERGSRTDFLYFVNEGRLKLVFHKAGQEILLKTLGSGDIAGEDAYFSISLCTATLVTVTTAGISLLGYDCLLKWKKEFPMLESKIRQYAERSGRLKDILREKGLDRRGHKRVVTSNDASIQFLKPSGTPVGRVLKGALADVSRGGVSVLLRINNEKTARILLGQRLQVMFTHRGGHFRHDVDKLGIVVAVYPQAFEDYSVSVRFDEPLSAQVLADIEQCPKRDSGR